VQISTSSFFGGAGGEKERNDISGTAPGKSLRFITPTGARGKASAARTIVMGDD